MCGCYDSCDQELKMVHSLAKPATKLTRLRKGKASIIYMYMCVSHNDMAFINYRNDYEKKGTRIK